jgi:hypothetical protein
VQHLSRPLGRGRVMEAILGTDNFLAEEKWMASHG